MLITAAEFLTSSAKIEQCPNDYRPEYAFVGRSNVGKSSLINTLVSRKSLAKTSSTPGKTRLINYFLINRSWYLVDLPGYGYARVSKGIKKKFQTLITSYLENRTQLINTFVLVDIRHSAQPIDLEFFRFLGEKDLPFSIVFTKADKLKEPQIKKRVESYAKLMKQSDWVEMPPYFISSSLRVRGKDEILNYIDNINKQV